LKGHLQLYNAAQKNVKSQMQHLAADAMKRQKSHW